MSVASSLRRFWDWAVRSEGSTRSAALLRIGLAVIVWARFGHDIGVYHDPSPARLAFVFVFGPVVTAMLIGYQTRVATLLTAALVTLLFGVLTFVTRSPGTHHVYFLSMALWLSALTPSGQSLSVDRWLALRRGDAAPEYGPLGGQRLLAIQVAVLYFWAAFDKSEPGYLTGERMQIFYVHLYGGPDWIYDTVWFRVVCRALAWTTVALEYTLAFGLFVPRLRLPLMLAGVIFHGIIYLTMSVFTFSATIVLLYLAFLDPGQVHRAIDVLLGYKPFPPPSSGTRARAAT